MTDKGTILIVDDTLASLKLLSDILMAEGYAVRPAQSGELALRSASMNPPALILLDIRMPGIDGFETCRRLKDNAQTKDVPVIFLSAMTEIDEKVQGFAIGAVDFVSKPFQREELLARVRTHLALRVAQEALRRANGELEATNGELSRTLATLKQTQDELIRSAKLAGLGAIVTGVAHELNTPIGNALLTASTLHDSAKRMQPQITSGALTRTALNKFVNGVAEGTELLERSLARATELVQRFKQVAVDQTSDCRRVFALNDMAQSVLMTLRPQLQTTTHRISVDIAATLQMDSFPGALEQILSNLLSNALLHGFEGRAEGGVLRIEAAAIDGDRLSLCVSDNGNGIPASRLSMIFDPFFTTKLGTGRSGIGLYLVYNLVTQVLGGHIDVQSAPGEGARFTLELPRVAPQQADAA